MDYEPGEPQDWAETDLGSQSAYPTITGGIFEFGFPDAIQQMWAAFLDELAHGDDMRGPFRCATPAEAAATHRTFTAALRSDGRSSVEPVEPRYVLTARRPEVGQPDRSLSLLAVAIRLVAKQLPVPQRPDVSGKLRQGRAASLAKRVHRHLDDHTPVRRDRGVMDLDPPFLPGRADVVEVLPDAVVTDVRPAVDREHGEKLDLRVARGKTSVEVAAGDRRREAPDNVVAARSHGPRSISRTRLARLVRGDLRHVDGHL